MKRKLILIVLFSTFFGFSQFNQGGMGGQRGGGFQNQVQQPRMEPAKPVIPTDEEILKKMTVICKLDDLQQLQMREFLLTKPKFVEPKTKEEMEALVAQSQKTDAKLQKILTPEQFVKWNAEKGKPLVEKKPETRKERKEREKKEAEFLENLK